MGCPLYFFDQASDRLMKLELWNETYWVFYKHPDGQWVSLREASSDDLMVLKVNSG